jgi:parallel beta-helix repeat protein
MNKAVSVFTLFLLLSAILSAPVQAESETADRLPESLEAPGRVDGSGTYFQINNSKYLDINIESTAEIKLTLESVPHVVTMAIESAVNVASTQLTLGGLLPSTTYYKYEDDFHNLEVFTTDAAGIHLFVQDITKSHIIFILPGPSTYFIRDDADGGDCLEQSIGTWDAENKICTLIKDVDQTIQIDSDGITLDGAGFSLIGSLGGFGIYLPYRMDVTIKNLTIEQFTFGIYLYQSQNNKLTGNTLTDNGQGIYLWGQSDDNTLSDNNITNHDGVGICLGNAINNKLTGNLLDGNFQGIYLYYNSNDNVLIENTATGNFDGIYLDNSHNNVITDNSVSLNIHTGISLTYSSDNNTLTGNTLSNNSDSGLDLNSCSNNIIYNNNFIDNIFQAKINSGLDNIFYMDAPAGGNYWNDYDEPGEGCFDDDHDGFCDDPYEFNGVYDEFSWAIGSSQLNSKQLNSDGDDIPDDQDDCPNTAGPADQNGCPYAVETHVAMRIVDSQRSGVCGYNNRGRAKRSCTVDLGAVMVRIYDREDAEFLETYGHKPSRRRLDDIFQADIGLSGRCTTDAAGQCLVGEDNSGKSLLVAKYVDEDGCRTAYIGKFKGFKHHKYGRWWNWHQNDADADSASAPTKIVKNIHFTKLIPKNGHAKFKGKHMMIVSGP